MEKEDLSYPIDFLRRLAESRICSENQDFVKREAEDDLCLGLSLGGCFGLERREMRLVRSSSIASVSVFPKELLASSSSSLLFRSCSLPVEANEENRKRKEMQSLKRMEAKRKRTEKRGGLRSLVGMKKSGLEESDLSSLSNSSAVTSLPDTDRKPASADSFPPRLRSLNSFQEDNKGLKRMTINLNRPKDMGKNMLDEMPCVSVKGDGPNGKRIEGFLYKYRKGEEVRIVCVCHGSFLTPAEFVKHAGGGNVTNPLRHIVVSPSPSIYY